MQTLKIQISLRICTLWSRFSLLINIFYNNQGFFSYTVKMALCLPIFLDHNHNGLFQMLMFIWCFGHFVFIAWVIDLAIINLSSGLRLLVPTG